LLAGALDRLGGLKRLRQKLGGLLLAEASITVTLSPPPGVDQAVSNILNRLMWGGMDNPRSCVYDWGNKLR